MATIKELSNSLRQLPADQEFIEKRITIGFEILELYCTIAKPTEVQLKDCCYAAVILGSMAQKGLGKRAKDFLEQHSNLPKRAITVLRGNLMRMEGY